MPERDEEEMRREIESFINQYDGTSIGWTVKNMYSFARDIDDLERIAYEMER